MRKRSIFAIATVAGLWLLWSTGARAACDPSTQDLGTRASAAYNATIAHADASTMHTAIAALQQAATAYATCLEAADDASKPQWGYPHGEISIEYGILVYVQARDAKALDAAVAQAALHAIDVGAYELENYGPRIANRNAAQELGYLSDAENFNDEIRIRGFQPQPGFEIFALNPDLDASAPMPPELVRSDVGPTLTSIDTVCPGAHALNQIVQRLTAMMPQRRYTGYAASTLAISLEPCTDRTGVKDAAMLLLADIEYADDSITDESNDIIADDRAVMKVDLSALDEAKSDGSFTPALLNWLSLSEAREGRLVSSAGIRPKTPLLAEIYQPAQADPPAYVEQCREIMGW